jgi:tRNA(Ile2) C34 agmatinyltransferase TiaS
MKLFICIDDTDNLESIGTGEVLENLRAACEQAGLARSGYISRHQLLVHEDIPYTSHNSAMCCRAETEDLEALIPFCRAFMDRSCAEGSDPGLCIALEGRGEENDLITFGQRAKREVLCKADARALASRLGESVFLSEHGGTGDGIVGALAGCGLRMSGYDGRVKGKLKPADARRVYTIGEFCSEYGLDLVLDERRKPVPESDTVAFRGGARSFAGSTERRYT